MAGTEGQGVVGDSPGQRQSPAESLSPCPCGDSAFSLCWMGSPETRGPGQVHTEQDSSREGGGAQAGIAAKKRRSLKWGHLSQRDSKGGGPEKRAGPGHNLKVVWHHLLTE